MNFRILMVVATGSMLLMESAAAAKCKFRQDTNDYFSGALTLRTAWKRNDPYYSAVEEAGKRWLEIKVGYSKQHEFLPTEEEIGRAMRIPEGTMLEITLAKGAVIELPAMDTTQATTKVGYPYEGGRKNYRRYVSATVRYVLDDASIDALSKQKASKVHVTGENADGQEVWVDMYIPKRGLKQIQEAVSCLRKGDTR